MVSRRRSHGEYFHVVNDRQPNGRRTFRTSISSIPRDCGGVLR
jgi:hypothetical protein